MPGLVDTHVHADEPGPVHIVHHSTATAIPIVEAAQGDGLPRTAETCPHYLHFADLVVWRPEAEFQVDVSTWATKTKSSPIAEKPRVASSPGPTCAAN